MPSAPLFPPETSTKRFYERATFLALMGAWAFWLPMWALSPLRLTRLPELWQMAGGSVGIVLVYGLIRALESRIDPAEMSFPRVLEALPLAQDVLRLSLAKLWMGFLLPIITFHLLVWSPGFADDALVKFDHMIGLDHYAWAMWVRDTGLRIPLLWAYDSLWAQSMLILFWFLILVRQTDRLWGMAALSVWAGLAAMPVFYLAPALGPITHHADYPPELIHPAYQLLKGLSDGSIVDVHRLDGIISMPSFHTFFALTMLWGAWGYRWLMAIVVPVNAALILSVYPVGFHYSIDILGGVVWFGITAFLMEVARRRAVG